jgi:hypothetical protein
LTNDLYRQADCDDITPDTTLGELAESFGVSVEDLGFTADGEDVYADEDEDETMFGGLFGGDDDDEFEVDEDDVDADVDTARLQQNVQADTAAIVGDLQSTFGDIQAAFGQLFNVAGPGAARVQQTNEDVANDVNTVIQDSNVAFTDAVQATNDVLAAAMGQLGALFGGRPAGRR